MICTFGLQGYLFNGFMQKNRCNVVITGIDFYLFYI